MDYRSASQSHGTSPLKAAGLLVGLLIVVALAFALGMKAGHELDLLRRDDGGEVARVAAHESRGTDSERATRTEPPTAQRGGDAAAASRELGGEPAAPSVPAASSVGHGKPVPAGSAPSAGGHSIDATASARGDRAAPREPTTPSDAATATKPPPTPPVPSPAFDYGMFKSTSGANAGSATTKPAAASEASRASAPVSVAEAPTKASAPVALPTPRTDAAKPQADARDPKVAVAKPPPVVPKKPDAARAPAPAASPKLTIAPEAPAKPAKPEDVAAPGFVVQVAELDSKADADQLLTRLKAHGIAAAAAKVDMPTGARYRIRVGRYKTMAEAKAAQKRVTAAGFAGSAIVSSR